jgi:hypothetical protein
LAVAWAIFFASLAVDIDDRLRDAVVQETPGYYVRQVVAALLPVGAVVARLLCTRDQTVVT